MKKIFLSLLVVLISLPIFIIGYNTLLEEELSPVIKNYTQMTLPENVSDNAAVELAAILRPEDVSLDQVKQRIQERRSEYHLLSPQYNKPLYIEEIPANDEVLIDVPVFKGMPFMFYCWLTLEGTYQQCLKESAMKQAVTLNSLYLKRYEALLDKESFVGDTIVRLPKPMRSLAYLHMAYISYLFEQGAHEPAFIGWQKHHIALQRFIQGSHRAVDMDELLSLYQISLNLLERMLYKGLDKRYFPAINKILISQQGHPVNVDGVLRADVGFNIRQINKHFRPAGTEALTKVQRWLVPGVYKEQVNKTVVPLIKQYKDLTALPYKDLTEEIEHISEKHISEKDNTSVFFVNKKAMMAIDHLGIYLKNSLVVLPRYYEITAKETALSLAIRIKERLNSAMPMDEWLNEQKDLYNPLTGEPFTYHVDDHALSYTDMSGKEVLTYIPPASTPIASESLYREF